MIRIALTVNGKPVTADVAPRTHLADFLREQLLLTGTHIGCEHGICGACTVEIDGEIARSCITYAVACDGARVRTIEGFDDDAVMGRLRDAFKENHALQCGYCTPGMLVAARDLVRRKRGLSRSEIRTEMSGNLCRCTGYIGILNAIEGVMNAAALPPQAAAPGDRWLGPAPGLVTTDSIAPATPPPQRQMREIAVPQSPHPVPGSAITPVQVEIGAIEQIDGATRITQSFTLPHPRAQVWTFLSDPQAVAACMPGMSLDGPPQGEIVHGRMQVKIGPIAASFAGEGTIRTFAAEYRQVIEGRGGDRKSGSRATGTIDLRLSEAGTASAATRVDTVISYTLTGALAQFGRSNLVRDLVARIGSAFAQNLDARLRQPDAELPAVGELSGLSLLAQILADRIRSAIRRLLRRAPR